MAHAHAHWLSHEWFELHPRLVAAFRKHLIALNVVLFVLMVAVLLSLFEWAQILPEQMAVAVESNSPILVSEPEPARGVANIEQRDQFLAQKKAAPTEELPAQF